MATPSLPERFVLYVDLLGFSFLTENFGLDIEALRAADRPGVWTMDLIHRLHDNQLTRAFRGFHSSLKGAIMLAQMSHPLTAITFSDCAFIATETLFQASTLAIGVIQSLLQQQIPARMGIARGTFAAIRFRSDVSDDGGDHAAHFLGTGVVRSHSAESCGIGGIRILLHPSALALVSRESQDALRAEKGAIGILECSSEESENAREIRYELDYWRLGRTAEAEAWRALQDMWKAAPKEALRHYEATARAIDRMRVGQGAPPLANLRRRTLPRFERTPPFEHT